MKGLNGYENRKAALACADAIYIKLQDSATALNNLAWALLTKKQYGGQYDDLALKFSTRSNELTQQKRWMFLDTLALAKFRTGDVDAAVMLERKAIDRAGDAAGDELRATLARFETAQREAQTGQGG